MFRLFYQYLVSNKKAGIPGIGIFSIEREPARLDFANKVFVAPAYHIHFAGEDVPADARFNKYVSAVSKIDEAQAEKDLHEFAVQLRETVSQNKSVQLPALGRLFVNESGEFKFEEEPQLKNYFPDVAAQRVVRQNAEHTILVGDANRTNIQMQEQLVEEKVVRQPKERWWIAAVILAVIGIAFIVYYYMINGSLA